MSEGAILFVERMPAGSGKLLALPPAAAALFNLLLCSPSITRTAPAALYVRTHVLACFVHCTAPPTDDTEVVVPGLH